MKVLTANQIKTAEQNAVLNGIFSYAELMKKAGNSAAQKITELYNVTGKKICVICGNGNNGGDGIVIAANLKHCGADVSLMFPLGMPQTDTARNFTDLVKNIKIAENYENRYDITVDALFGIGLNRILSGKVSDLINQVNNADGVKIAVDVPSGVFCDGGEVSIAFKADLTLTFSAYKLCQLLPHSSKYCGDTYVLDIDLPLNEYAYETIDAPITVKRSKFSHKGTYGTALLFCGSYGMCGAEILSARAALRSGVGIVKALVCDKNYTAFTSAVPEAVTIPVDTDISGSPLVYDRTVLSTLSSSNALLIGCGLGQNKVSTELVLRTLEKTQIPTVLDADGINAVAGNIDIIRKVNAPIILTPHPAEMARLCNTTVDVIESNRVKIAKKFAIEYNCYLVLKGTNTIIATPHGRILFNTTGNDGLSTGGSGDVLAGMIVSRLAQGYSPIDAVVNSVYIHGKIADCLAEKMSTRAIIPTDIIEGLKLISD